MVKSEKEVDDILNRCLDSEDSGELTYPGMSYEQGVRAGIEWALRNGPHPFTN